MTTPDERAEMLLMSVLDADQQAEFREKGQFHVTAKSGRIYRIKRGWAGNVYCLDDEGNATEYLCIHPTERIPDCDNMLSQLLMILGDEDTFRNIANITAPAESYPDIEQYPVRLYDDVVEWIEACIEGVRQHGQIESMDDPRRLLIGFLIDGTRHSVPLRVLRHQRENVPDWFEPFMLQRRDELAAIIAQHAGIMELAADFPVECDGPINRITSADIMRNYFATADGRERIAQSFRHPLILIREVVMNQGATEEDANERVYNRVRESLWTLMGFEAELRDLISRIPWPDGCPPKTYEEIFDA